MNVINRTLKLTSSSTALARRPLVQALGTRVDARYPVWHENVVCAYACLIGSEVSPVGLHGPVTATMRSFAGDSKTPRICSCYPSSPTGWLVAAPPTDLPRIGPFRPSRWHQLASEHIASSDCDAYRDPTPCLTPRFPGAAVIHVVRDGRDVASSTAPMHTQFLGYIGKTKRCARSAVMGEADTLVVCKCLLELLIICTSGRLLQQQSSHL